MPPTSSSGGRCSSPAWLPRTQERLEVPLCGGRVVLAGVVDLVLGSPAQDRASVCLVELKSGARRIEHRPDLHFYALLEALRSGAPPFRIATYYSGTGELDAEPVGEDTLVGALSRALDGAIRLCRVAAGSAARRDARTISVPGVWAFRGVARASSERAPTYRSSRRGDRPRTTWGVRDGGAAPGRMADRSLVAAAERGRRAGRVGAAARRPRARPAGARGGAARRRASPDRRLQGAVVAHRHPDRCMASDDTFVPSPRLVSSCGGRRRRQPVRARPRSRSGGRGGPGAGRRARGRRASPSAPARSGRRGGRSGTGHCPPVAGRWWRPRRSRGRRSCSPPWIGRWSPRPVIGGRDDWWQCPGGTPIVLKGRAEVRTLVGRRPALLVVGLGPVPGGLAGRARLPRVGGGAGP